MCLLLLQRLNALAALVRGQLPTLHRNIITALITIDVHARDIVTDLVRQKVQYCHVSAEGQTQITIIKQLLSLLVFSFREIIDACIDEGFWSENKC